MNMRVLVAEDDEPVIELICAILQGAGHGVMTARDGLEALDLLNSNLPDVILLDVNMPRMSGFDVLERLKSHPTWNEVPVIMLTAQSSSEDIRKAMKLGASDYIGKPFEPLQLLRRLNKVMDRAG